MALSNTTFAGREKIPVAPQEMGNESQNKLGLMKKLEILLRPSTFEAVRTDLEGLGLGVMTATEVRCCQKNSTRRSAYRGTPYEVFVPKVKLEILVAAAKLAQVVEILSRGSQAGETNDEEKVLIFDLAEVVQIPRNLRPEMARQ